MKHRNFTRTFSARSYTGRRLRNPFFGHEPRRVNPYLVLGGTITSIIALGALFFYLPFLQYRDIRIEGLTTLSADAVAGTASSVIDQARLLVVPGRHVFFMNGKKLTTALMDAYNFDHLALRREGRTLVVQATERITQLAWVSGDGMHLIDLSGLAVSEANEEVRASLLARLGGAGDAPPAPGLQPTMPIIENTKAEPVTPGTMVLAPEKLELILELDAALRQRGIPPRSYAFEDATSPWMTVRTDSVALMVDLGTNAQNTMLMFDTFRHERSEPLETFLYIDLRFGNHVYIQTK